jgi:hypothetical protein
MALLLAAPPDDVAALDDAALLGSAEAAFYEGVVAKADAAAARRHFAAAASRYGALHERGVRNADLCRNWGNALLLSDQLPAAILAYRRGLRLAPDDAALHQQLEWARDQVQYPADERCRPAAVDWPPWLPRLRPEWVLFAAVACYALACAGVVRWRQSGLFPVSVVLALAAGVPLAYWSWTLHQQAEAGQPLAVVTRDGTELRKGNGKSYPPHDRVPHLNRGVEVRVRHRRGDWLQVELAGGELGWVRREDVLLEE